MDTIKLSTEQQKEFEQLKDLLKDLDLFESGGDFELLQTDDFENLNENEVGNGNGNSQNDLEGDKSKDSDE